jgi:3-hydroxyisobutyrate dehydrogenase
MSDPEIGVIGIGRMGLPIACRLQDAGFRVAATDLRKALAHAAQTAGLRWVDDVVELASTSKVVLTVLPGPTELRGLIVPVIENMRPGSSWIDMTSAVPAVSAEIRARAAGRLLILECPVGGNPDAARSGTLLGYLGADFEDLRAHRGLLDTLCHELVHVGPPGTGYAAKLLVNALWFGQALGVAELLALGSRVGLDPHALKQTIARGPAASRVADQAGEALLRGDDMATFGLGRCVEEIEGVLDLASGRGLRLPVTSTIAELYQQALERYGDVDGELLAARYLSEQLGVRFS